MTTVVNSERGGLFQQPFISRVSPPASKQKKRNRPPSRIQVGCLGEGGSPFFRCYGVAKRPDAAYKRERGLPLVPNPGPRTQTLSKEWYSLPYHEGSNQRATPISLSFKASCSFGFYLFAPNAPMKAALPTGALCWVAHKRFPPPSRDAETNTSLLLFLL